MTLAQHSKATARWGTPEDIVERARRVMGGIDLDPCSESKFQTTVKAVRYYSLTERGEDGLLLPWNGRVFVNPPGGMIRSFWERGLSQPVEQLIWIGFSMEQLGQLADASAHPSDFSICFLRKRISFQRHDDYEGTPSHANFVSGVNVDHATFVREFGPLGKIQAGPLSTVSRK